MTGTPNPQRDSDFIAETLPLFIGEAQEQIESIEQLLLRLEDEPDSHELLDALFRCAHTVKGSAGIFGLNDVVAFTHHVETLLDQLRGGRIAFRVELGTLLLQCNDEIRALVTAGGQGSAGDDGRDAQRQALIAQLQAAVQPDDAPHRAAPQAEVRAGGTPPEMRVGGVPPRAWHVSVSFGRDTFRDGMDPLAILSYLDKLGTVTRVEYHPEAVPVLEQLDPETCHLGVELRLDGATTREQIESAFSFVRNDIRLQVFDTAATPQDFARLIEDLPDVPRIGDILVKVGAITQAQLQQGLKAQADAMAADPEQAAPRLGEVLRSIAGLSPQVVSAALDKQQRGRSGGAAPEDQRFIRVQADRLDAVINLLGELVIASAGASMLAQQTWQAPLVKANQQVGRLIEEIRNSTLQLRMVPIGETFSRFRRVVRDTAGELGKDVVLALQGGETELDKSVVERIADPLMHLVRNALDHGLEQPAARLAAGKPAQGTLTLSACHEAGNILIRIADDGRGIPRDKVLARAHERGLVPPGVVPPDAEILKLIFEPGFSTAEQVTNLSGRGVGMDVVRRNIEGLRGSIDVFSEPGQGCRIDVRLPLTLAIIDGFLVGVGSAKFILPLDAVVEVIERRPPATAVDEHGRCVIELRGQVLPVVSLRGLYGLDGVAPERSSVVVVQTGGQRYGVLVDHLLGQHQTVIKPLGRLFRNLRGMSGSSILGNGEVALIFDAASLRHLACAPPTHDPRRPTGPPPHTPQTPVLPTSEGQAS